MPKTGPTPRPDASTAVARRRAPGPTLAEHAIALPPPEDNWCDTVRHGYRDYAASSIARLLREEDVPRVRLYFTYLQRVYDLLDNDTTPDVLEPGWRLKQAQEVRIYDSMARQLAAELGIGPLARARLGIQSMEAVKSAVDQFLEGDDAD